MAKYAIGLDYGTLSVRALLVNIETGEETGVSVYEYPHGVMDRQLPTGEALPSGWALQHPQDYREGLIHTVKAVMAAGGVLAEEIVGIGVDFTGSTVLPVRDDGYPLCLLDEFKREPHAYVKLWKHHGGEREAEQIEQLAKVREEEWLPLYGGKVSSEWMLPKVMETLHEAETVFACADRFVDAADWLVWQLTGEVNRSICTSGYKFFYHHEKGDLSKDFLRELDPRMENFVEEKIAAPVKGIGEKAGTLTKEWADILGLVSGIPVGMGIVDAHASILGSGIAKPGEMMIVVGTSSCHMLLEEKEAPIPGICGVVKGGMVPGYFGYEAGQSCVGDQFAWFMDNCVPDGYIKEAEAAKISIHQLMVEKLKDYKAGQSGLVALDWFNGVRSPLVDFRLNGLILGLNLQTRPEDIYMAMIESTAYGTRLIMDQYEQAGIQIHSIVLGGGIPLKNPMLVQVYADILNRDVSVSGTSQASGLGAAILGISAAGESVTGYKDIYEIIEKIGKRSEKIWHPRKEQVDAYNSLYEEYKTLCDYFGKGANDVMKRLHEMRKNCD